MSGVHNPLNHYFCMFTWLLHLSSGWSLYRWACLRGWG